MVTKELYMTKHGQAFLFLEESGDNILAEKNLGSAFHGDQGSCLLAIKGYYGGKGKNMGPSPPSSLLSLPPALQPQGLLPGFLVVQAWALGLKCPALFTQLTPQPLGLFNYSFF